MKRVLIVALLCLMVLPVMGSVSPIKTDFQDYVEVTSWPVTQGDWIFTKGASTTYSNIETDVYGHKYAYTQEHTEGVYPYITSTSTTPFIYAAFTTIVATGQNIDHAVYLENSLGHSVYWGASLPGRYEITVAGGTATLYRDDVVIGVDNGWEVNPSFFRNYAYGGAAGEKGYFDDIILGYADDSTIIGSIPPDWFIREDSTANATRGLYQLNTTDPTGTPTVKSSYHFGLSYGRPYPDATVLTITNPSGVAVKSYPVANMSCQCVIPITALSVGGAPIQNGKWSVSLADTPTVKSYFWVLSSGGWIVFDKSVYNIGDTGSMSWYLSSGHIDLSTYTYTYKILDIYGNEKTSGITATTNTDTSGTVAITFDPATYSQGVLYAEMIATSKLDGSVSILGFTAITLQDYLGFYGHVYDANSTLVLSGAKVNFTQLGTSHVQTTAADGNYSFTGFTTGGTLYINASKSGYGDYGYAFTPTTTGNKSRDIVLIPTTPLASGISMNGLIQDNVYGRPIPNAVVTLTNTSHSTSHTVTANSRGYYLIDNTHSGTLVSGYCYMVNATLLKYNQVSPSALRCVV